MWGPKELAARLGVSEKTARGYMRRGFFGAFRLRKLWMVDPKAVEAAISGGSVPNRESSSSSDRSPAPTA